MNGESNGIALDRMVQRFRETKLDASTILPRTILCLAVAGYDSATEHHFHKLG